MKTFLFAYNPHKWLWDAQDQAIREIARKGSHLEMWSIVSHKAVSVGDRAFLMQLGRNTPHKGIVGAGYVASEPFLAAHWSNDGRITHHIYFEFDALSSEPIVSLPELRQLPIPYDWTPRMSGVEIPEGVARKLEERWFDRTLKKVAKSASGGTYKEGAVRSILSRRYERSPQARRECLEANGYSCAVCGFDFERTYGELGRNFIHVHHVKPLSTLGKAYEIDPRTDLVPICPNCHAMIHRTDPARSVEELKKAIALRKELPY